MIKSYSALILVFTLLIVNFNFFGSINGSSPNKIVAKLYLKFFDTSDALLVPFKCFFLEKTIFIFFDLIYF